VTREEVLEGVVDADRRRMVLEGLVGLLRRQTVPLMADMAGTVKHKEPRFAAMVEENLRAVQNILDELDRLDAPKGEDRVHRMTGPEFYEFYVDCAPGNGVPPRKRVG
jgi:hypothetical protein